MKFVISPPLSYQLNSLNVCQTILSILYLSQQFVDVFPLPVNTHTGYSIPYYVKDLLAIVQVSISDFYCVSVLYELIC